MNERIEWWLKHRPGEVVAAWHEALARAVKVGDCLRWGGRLDKDGLPVFTHRGRQGFTANARRLVYVMTHGGIPDGQRVMSSRECALGRECVAVEHLHVRGGATRNQLKNSYERASDDVLDAYSAKTLISLDKRRAEDYEDDPWGRAETLPAARW